MARKPVHPAIRSRLGYGEDETDDEIYDDWKGRLRRVCKPCWELKYCPYGPFVEQSPVLPGIQSDQSRHNEYLKNCLETGLVGSIQQMTDDLEEDYREWLEDEQLLISQVLFEWDQAERFGSSDTDDENTNVTIQSILGGPLPPIQEYRVQFDNRIKDDYEETNFEPEVWKALMLAVQERRAKIEDALEKGEIDDRKPIEPKRRKMFESMIANNDPDSLPKEIPTTFLDGQCSIFGHICPVFFAAEAATESEVERRIGRKNLRFESMMRIVRRDDYRCQHCKEKLRDDEVEFDHIIPVSKGGSSEEHNMRLTCYDCNRDKSDSYNP